MPKILLADAEDMRDRWYLCTLNSGAVILLGRGQVRSARLGGIELGKDFDEGWKSQ